MIRAAAAAASIALCSCAAPVPDRCVRETAVNQRMAAELYLRCVRETPNIGEAGKTAAFCLAFSERRSTVYTGRTNGACGATEAFQ